MRIDVSVTQASAAAEVVGTIDMDSARIEGGGRRNLVILRAGDASLHGTWLPPSFKRNWDLHISYFGSKEAPTPLDKSGVTWSRDTDNNKWNGIARAVGRQMFSLDDYDYVAVPDDDLIGSPETWNAAFDLARRHGLNACQLSLHHASFFGHLDTLKQPCLELRYAPVVELMAGIIRVDVFKKMIPYLSLQDNLWAMDYVVAHLLAEQPRSMAILDAVSVLHTRDFWTGPLYSSSRASGRSLHQIEADFLSRHGLERVERRNLGGVTRGGRFLKRLWWTAPLLIPARLLRKYRHLRGLRKIAHAEEGRVYLLRRFASVSGLEVAPDKVAKAR
jgi:hypothetical protein